MSKEKIKRGLDGIFSVAKYSFKYIIPIVAVSYGIKLRGESINEIWNTEFVGYDDVVSAISNCSMFSSDKTKAIALLRRNESVGYYKAFMAILNSHMFSSDKITAIQKINLED